MVSSLIIGSETAVIIDLPFTVPQAHKLAEWVTNMTDKPLVAAFTTHFHPDHYLSGAAFLAKFPESKYYANSKAAAQIAVEAEKMPPIIKALYGNDSVIDKVALPTPYDFSFFTLSGDEKYPIQFLSQLTGDTVYGRDTHIWLTDPAHARASQTPGSSPSTPSRTSAPKRIVPGHAASVADLGPSVDLNHTREYVTFFQRNIEPRGPEFFTPAQIADMLNASFPVRAGFSSEGRNFLLNASAEQWGRGGTRRVQYLDLESMNSTEEISSWKL